jgi:polar amino acid transport system substrate-binding protein
MVVLSGGETMSQRPLAAVAALLFALLQMISPAAHAGSVLDRIKSTGVLVVATDPDWAPTSWRKDNGDFDGMDVDVSKEIARRMGVRVSFYMPYSFEAVVAGSWNGKWDIATSVTPTLQRAEAIEFAAVYYYGLSSLAVHRDNADMQEPSEASGKKIGVVTGTEYEKYLTREPFDIVDMPSFTYKIDRPEIVRFDDQNALHASLAKGNGTEIDGIIDATDALMQKISEGAPFRIVGQPLIFTPSSIVVERGDDTLVATLKEIIEAMHKDGTLTRLSMKWFGVDLTQY